jgi:hypothetical protein
MTSRRWRVREAVLTHHLRQPHRRCPEGKPSFPDRLLDQGRNVAEYLAVLPSRDARLRVLGVESSAGFTAGPED